MLHYFLADEDLVGLRQRQRHLRTSIDEFASRELPRPVMAGLTEATRRMIEVAIRLRCEAEIEVSVDLVTRIESNRCREVFAELARQDSISAGPHSSEARFRAAEILRSVARDAQHQIGEDEDVAVLRRLAYLLDVADDAAVEI
jgi:hypothetical protein